MKLLTWTPASGYQYVPIAAVEILVAWIILFGQRAFAWWTATVVLAVLTIVSAVTYWNGADCNCFGSYTDTRYVLLFDVTALACLLGCGYLDRSLMKLSGIRSGLDYSIVYACMLALVAVIYLPQYSATAGQPVLNGTTVKGISLKECFAHSTYTGSDNLKNGILILLRPDCAKCHRFLRSPAFASWRESKIGEIDFNYVWLDSDQVWRIGSDPEEGVPIEWTGRPGWFTGTPVVLRVVDGKIQQLLSGDELLQGVFTDG